MQYSFNDVFTLSKEVLIIHGTSLLNVNTKHYHCSHVVKRTLPKELIDTTCHIFRSVW